MESATTALIPQTQSTAPANDTITVKTRSETDTVDDGYRWKKYGQKRIKNSPYQRSYFKCKTGGCAVKKRSQRCEDDPPFVLTTYQGTHNHKHDSESTVSRNSYDLKSQVLETVENAEAPAIDNFGL